ncbi:DHA2 family efflux MFS transporter permease subunit [Rhodococcus sp. PAMC28707]|uniref:DHA2 family efflux MFS transporter permease subunit n=1 Tax=unclassified Rhodococcus (in: high G+C Gram-positive bacteria) TaxID=192944 RepID=UPI00109E08A0|nr:MULTISPECIES: DHA2 family efflux MFS transporter permease subunit [unclassified Rhodococcus (in: high G+C Gram-positive bacteria)]QCB52182.1 DHA2 family efflux MFS transporter permease subunit [Rhodococcus sp. PAMC28705]QCB59648.1 DHA2 family efflux MFS transporter permease subunit [Rhodococcus sp. PAMC28707]
MNTVVAQHDTEIKPWPTLWALCLGFFMILVDTTIVAVAQPAILQGLQTDINNVIWVTSAYLLAYAVPLLVTGRLGDRFGPRRLYIAGLVVFTMASAWCGLSGSIEMLIAARAVQGLGAAMITPQTMAVITRVFPAEKRGTAMGAWGAVAGVATLVGPILGGVLVDTLGWEWIFFINIPVGVVAIALALKFVPVLPTHEHKFDLLGVVLSAVGLFCIVFGIQEGQKYDWDARVWGLVAGGMIVFAVFIYWQAKNKNEPLVPLALFRDRNFSLSNVGIATMGFAMSGMMLPIMFYAQSVTGLSPTRSALLFVPMAILTGALAPNVGRLVDRMHPRYLAATGLLLLSAALLGFASVMTPTTAIWKLLIPIAVMGVANALIWSPLAATATRNLPMSQAGAGSGIYNTTRMVGSVLGSAGIGALIQSRLAAEIPESDAAGADEFSGRVPEMLQDGFTTAMAQSLILPAIVLLIGVVAVAFYARPAFK